MGDGLDRQLRSQPGGIPTMQEIGITGLVAFFLRWRHSWKLPQTKSAARHLCICLRLWENELDPGKLYALERPFARWGSDQTANSGLRSCKLFEHSGRTWKQNEEKLLTSWDLLSRCTHIRQPHRPKCPVRTPFLLRTRPERCLQTGSASPAPLQAAPPAARPGWSSESPACRLVGRLVSIGFDCIGLRWD